MNMIININIKSSNLEGGEYKYECLISSTI